MTFKFTNIMASIGIILAMIKPGYAAIEIDEEDFGPSYNTMLVDTVIGKPLQLISALAGTAAFIASLPFTLASESQDQSFDKLVEEPWQAMSRCLGCSVAEDNYYKSQITNDNEVRIVVDRPSEIIITTSDRVIVIPQ